MTYDEIENKTCQVLCDQLSINRATIGRGTSFEDDLELDTLGLGSMIRAAIEAELEVAIPDKKYEKMKTVGDVIDFVAAKYGVAGNGGEGNARELLGTQCKRCLHANLKGAKFCSQCGNPLSRA